MRRVLLAIALFGALPLSAQILPMPGADNPRIQSVRWSPQEQVVLTAMPGSGLTVLLEPGELINRVTLENNSAFDVRVSPERDSFLVLPKFDDAVSAMMIETDRRIYRFDVQTGTGLTAAYLVRFAYDDAGMAQPAIELPSDSNDIWSYRLKGDKSLWPQSIHDNGVQTRIHFAPEQALPAIFAIGPTGDEEVVNGHMRDDVFVIDRVHTELVFRIDKDKATARRNAEAEDSNG